MTKDKIKTQLQDNPTPAPPEPPVPQPVIKPMNYKAVEYLGWFMSDAQSVRNWGMQLFSSDVDLNSSRVSDLKAAADNALDEIEDDVIKIRAFLAEYKQDNKNK
jgi:hypothetical protein